MLFFIFDKCMATEKLNRQILHSIEHVGVVADCQFVTQGHTTLSNKEEEKKQIWGFFGEQN